MYGAPSVLWVDFTRPAVPPAARKGRANDKSKQVAGSVRLSGALNSKAARALHRAALEANCRAGPGSVRRLDNERGYVAFHGADQ